MEVHMNHTKSERVERVLAGIRPGPTPWGTHEVIRTRDVMRAQRCSRSTARRTLLAMVDVGLVRIMESGGRGTPTLYQVTVAGHRAAREQQARDMGVDHG
jgi:DNA-binding IclR family transcriptional regulator